MAIGAANNGLSAGTSCGSRAESTCHALALLLLAVVVGRANGGVLETDDSAGFVEFMNTTPPIVLTGGLSDLTMMTWVRRTTWQDGVYSSVLDFGDVLRVGFDDDLDGVSVELVGTSRTIPVLVPLRDASEDQKAPVDEWILVAWSWDASESRLTAWAQSESTTRASASAADPQWSGDEPWPLTIGAAGGAPGFTGQIGLLVIRDHVIDAGDFDAIWNDGAPRYFAPFRLDAGNMTGFPGTLWMIGHGVITTPAKTINPQGTGAELGDALTINNALVYSTRTLAGFFTAGRLREVGGEWTIRSPHETGEEWSGFFDRERPDLALEKPLYVARTSPRARRLADDDPGGLTRVIASANSRAVRDSDSYGLLENWAHGGLFAARRGTVAGVIIPGIAAPKKWPGFNGTARLVGPVFDSQHTPFNSVAFGNFGSHGIGNSGFPDYVLAGRAAVIEDGSAYVPKVRPEPGTRFADQTEPLTVRTMLLGFPGSGRAVYQGEKAATQTGDDITNDGAPTEQSLDTTMVVHAMVAPDTADPKTRMLTLDRVAGTVEVGYGCFVSAGAGAGGISVVERVDTLSDWTIVTLERWFPADPLVGSSVLRFGPVEPIWVQHDWAGLAPDDPQEYRGIRIAAEDGIVVALFSECFNPAADGFIIGGVGKGGVGYTAQLRDLFQAGGIPFMRGLDADVWLQFFAQQAAQPESMSDYAAAIRLASPETEIWWCGDPDFDTTVDDSDGTDAWQAYLLDHAGADGVGAVVAQEHPSVGTGAERAVDGQTADEKHLSGRGCERYVAAVLDILREAALDGATPCPADLNGNDGVDFGDVLILLSAWGPCPPEPGCGPDLDGDGEVGFDDLLTLLSAWGPCPDGAA